MRRVSKRKGHTVKLYPDERRDVQRAAALAGQPLGTWVREVAVVVARRRLRKVLAQAKVKAASEASR